MSITLESYLKEVSEREGSKLYSNWMVIKEELCNKLETVSSYFQHFSLHNATHSKEICNNIERFLGEDRIRKLSPTDVWLLLMAFYSHDVGMALKYNDIVNTFEEQKFKGELKELIEGNNTELKKAAERILTFEKENNNLKPIQGKALDIFRDVQLIIEEHYRKGHAARSADYIGEFLDEKYSLINPRIIELLKKVCIAHQEDIKNIENLHYEENGLFQDYVHPRFVAGMLCLGDLLDMDTNRFSKYGLEAASTMANESKLHLEKHRALKHFLIKPNGIEIEMDSPSMEVHRVARDWVHWIDETIDYLTLKWSCIAPNDFGNPPKIAYKKLLIKGSDLFNEYADLKFTIDQSKALELLQGANIYKDKFVCIREVIQNAMDSSLIQLWKDIDIKKKKKKLEEVNERDKICRETLKCEKYNEIGKRDLKTEAIIDFWENLRVDEKYQEKLTEEAKRFNEYPIEVSVYFDEEDKVTIEVSDKGTGISNIALKSIANIGTKKDKRNDRDIIESMPGWLKPSGQFGLGLQSIFLISDKFEMITKSHDEPGKKIIFENVNNNTGYITVEPNNRHERGTTVKIHIDEAKIEASDFQTDELSFKLKDKKDFIMELILSKAKNNQFIGELGENDSSFDIKNYFYVNIHKIDKFNQKEDIPSNKSLFSDNSLGCFLENGELQITTINSQEKLVFEYFERENKSLCKIAFVLPEIENREEGELFKFTIKSGELCELYYKNVFVCELYSDSKYMFDRQEMKYFKFSLNLFDNKADSILEISRNAIKENYRTEFSKVVRHTLINVFQAINNNLIEKRIELEEYNLTILYQLFKFFGINTDKFIETYRNKLWKFSFVEKFYRHNFDNPGHIELNTTIDEIFKAKYKIIEAVKDRYYVTNSFRDFLDKIDDKKVEKINIKDVADNILEVKKYLNGITFDGDSLISHSLIASKIVKLNNEFYNLYEFAPFIISENQVLPMYDEIYLIDLFVKISKEKEREMIGLENFKNLVIEKFEDYRLKYIIKLPFKDEHYDKVIDSIKKDLSFDKSMFKKEVVNTDYFNCLVDYVSSKKKLHSDEIRHAYEKLIDKYMELLIKPDEKDNPYKEFVKCLVDANEEVED
ncbi:hypothetical protein CDLVIII_3814 [Clostridium sp. DL-VIII]|uniref:HD domain-containing protein n=1 Tax=Clostridium sp. DL-VIII TaxID=641107 RepID=UPI00023AFFD8|nr:ATP-binding protein [Clostridium sp. DL-VIII]EHJ00363.1 hypothetical protein CDLVIII_3814 [Clostridium sp. DL-VIII]